jgi:hypothetical protein
VAQLRYYPEICLGGQRKTTENVSQNGQYPGRDSNRAPPEYKYRCHLYTNLFIFSLGSLFWKKKSFWNHLAVCVSVYHPLINFWMPEPIFTKLDMCIMAPETITTAYFTNPSHQCVCVYPTRIVARKRLGKNVPAATQNCWRCLLYEVRVVSKESRRLILQITSC